MRKEDLMAESLQRMISMRMKPEIIRNFSSGKLVNHPRLKSQACNSGSVL